MLALVTHMQELKLGSGFNQDLGVLPAALRVLKIHDLWGVFKRPLGLPHLLQVLDMGPCFNKPLIALPPGLRELRLPRIYTHRLPAGPLPRTLKALTLPAQCAPRQDDIPAGTVVTHC
jgi:hypothetical protein